MPDPTSHGPDSVHDSQTGELERGRHVMIVDDDVVALSALDRLVRQWGHDVVPFDCYERARASLTNDAPPDALVVDVRLGMFNGLQLIYLARQINPSMTVVAVSGFDDPVLRAEAAVTGASYLVKPVDVAELRRLVSELPVHSAVPSNKTASSL